MKRLPDPRQTRIALLVADCVNTALLERYGGLLTMYNRLFHTNVPDVNWHIEPFNVYQRQFPMCNAFDAFIITGSRYSVNDNLYWIKELEDFVHARIAEGRPVIGFCFGHQLLAKVIGGVVEKYPFGSNIGLSVVNIITKPAWLANICIPPYLVALSNHSEHITYLPKDAEIIASNNACPIQIFQKNNHVLGVQFHPEYEIDYQDALMARNATLSQDRLLNARKRNATLLRSDRQIAGWIKQFISTNISGIDCA